MLQNMIGKNNYNIKNCTSLITCSIIERINLCFFWLAIFLNYIVLDGFENLQVKIEEQKRDQWTKTGY